MHEIENKFTDNGRQNDHRSNNGTNDTHQKGYIISTAYTMIQPEKETIFLLIIWHDTRKKNKRKIMDFV